MSIDFQSVVTLSQIRIAAVAKQDRYRIAQCDILLLGKPSVENYREMSPVEKSKLHSIYDTPSGWNVEKVIDDLRNDLESV